MLPRKNVHFLLKDNITWTTQRAHEVYDWKYDQEQVVSYLPLSHVAGTFIDIYLIMYGGGTVWFADKMALQVGKGLIK